jgi:hypothetical protein
VEQVVKVAQQNQHDQGAKDQIHVAVLAAARAVQAWLWIAAQQLNDSVVDPVADDGLVRVVVGHDDGGTSGLRDESVLQRRGGEFTQLVVRRMIGHGSGLDGLDLEYQRAEGLRAKAGLGLMCECFGGVFQGAAELEGVSCGI